MISIVKYQVLEPLNVPVTEARRAIVFRLIEALDKESSTLRFQARPVYRHSRFIPRLVQNASEIIRYVSLKYVTSATFC